MSNIKQPFRWQGSKFRMLSKILPIIESARGDALVYAEPFGGAGTVLNALKPVKIEVYNDADERLVDFFRAIADDEALAKMKRWGETFPKSRAIYDEMKYVWIKSPELAKRGFATFYVQSFSFAGKPFDSFGVERKIYTSHDHSLPAAYQRKTAALDVFAERFRFVNIERLDWRECVAKYDSEQAFFYFDPPYCGKQKGYYRRNLPQVDHAELVEALLSVRGGVALSCYSNDVYTPLERAGWKRYDFEASSSIRLSTNNLGDARKRVETLYVKPADVPAL